MQIPNDLAIYLRVDGGLAEARLVLQGVLGGGGFETAEGGNASDTVYLVDVSETAYAPLGALHPQLAVASPETYVPDIDDWGFNVEVGFAFDATSLEQVDCIFRLARELASVVPAVLVDSDADQPLVDSRAGGGTAA